MVSHSKQCELQSVANIALVVDGRQNILDGLFSETELMRYLTVRPSGDNTADNISLAGCQGSLHRLSASPSCSRSFVCRIHFVYASALIHHGSTVFEVLNAYQLFASDDDGDIPGCPGLFKGRIAAPSRSYGDDVDLDV